MFVLVANVQAASLNIATGHLKFDQPVFAATGSSRPLSITLFYESLGGYSSLLGPGWTHSADLVLTPTVNSNVLVFRNGNSRTYYHQNVDGSYLPQAGDTSVLTKEAITGNYLITMSDGARFQFDSNGKLTAIIDPFNNTQSFVYDSTTGELATITDPAGRTAAFEYTTINNQRRLARIVPPGVSVSDSDSKKYLFVFSNNSTAQLTQVLQPLADDNPGTVRGSWNYTYDVSGRLKTATDPGSNTTCYNYYPDGRIQNTVDPEGLADADCQATVSGHTRSIVYNDTARTATFTDKSGNQWLYAYNSELGKLSSKQSPDPSIASEKSYYYPQTGYLKARTEPFGANQGITTFYTYDDNGNKIADTDPIDLSLAPYAGIDPDTVDTSTFDIASPIQWARAYQYYPANDPDLTRKNRLWQVTDNRSVPPAVTTYDRYDEEGLKVLRITDPEIKISYAKSYPDGRIRYSIDSNGKITTYDYYPDTTETRAAGMAGLLWKVTSPDGIMTTISTYDKSGYPREVTTADTTGAIRETNINDYDALFRLRTATRSVTGLTPIITTYAYDRNGNPNSVIDAENREIKYEYNYNRQITKTTQFKDDLPIETGFEYSATGCASCGGNGGDKLTKLIDAKQQATSFQYDLLGRLEYETDPLGNKLHYNYYDNNLVKEKFDATATPEKLLTTYVYNNRGQITDKIHTDGTAEHSTFYPDGKLQTISNQNITYTYEWYANGWLKSVTDDQGRKISYDEYDNLGQRKNVTILAGTPDQRVMTYDYDSANRPWKITSSAGTFTYGYDNLGRRETVFYPNGTVADYDFDDLGRITGITHKSTDGNPFASYTYPLLDKRGNRKTAVRNGAEFTHLYDDLYRLWKTLWAVEKEEFIYDPVGNRTVGPGAKDTAYLHNASNQVTHGRKLGYIYDTAGNQISKTQSGVTDKNWTQTWDNENRLIKVEKTKEAEKKTVIFIYDPLGRRIGKHLIKVIDGITKTSSWSYVYDNDNIAVELFTDDTGNVTKTFYTHGPNVDEHLALERSGQNYYCHADGLGSIGSITDANKNIIQSYEYDSFGMVKPSTNFRNSYTYTGREWDKETGLHYYRARYYDPMEGRFISRDPIGFDGGDMVLYGYTKNNPINYADPSGLTGASGSWSNGNVSDGTEQQDLICSFPATLFNRWSCTKKCCFKHDLCYQKYGCNYSSWATTPVNGTTSETAACHQCNIEAAKCIKENIGSDSCDICDWSGNWDRL